MIELEVPACQMGWEAYYKSGVEDDEDAIAMRQREVNGTWACKGFQNRDEDIAVEKLFKVAFL